MTKQVITRAALITVAVISFVGLTMPAQATSYDDVNGTGWSTTEQDYSTADIGKTNGGDTETVLPGHSNLSYTMTTHSSGIKTGFGAGLLVIGITALLIFLSRAIVEQRRQKAQ